MGDSALPRGGGGGGVRCAADPFLEAGVPDVALSRTWHAPLTDTFDTPVGFGGVVLAAHPLRHSDHRNQEQLHTVHCEGENGWQCTGGGGRQVCG